ncbi:MAG TPA: FtsX-like permease family protein [Acidobacteriota bacterium]|nr:FtsX-like permease family protein [Acidobacteriota bacterium]
MAAGIERQKNVLDFTLSSLARRKGKNLALLAVYALLVFLVASVLFATSAIRKEAAALLREAPEMVVQRTVAGRQDPIPLSYLDQIRSIAGVISADGRLWGYYYDPVVGANYTLLVPREDAPEAGTVTIGPGVARVRMAAPGDLLEFKRTSGGFVELAVGGILAARSELVASDLVLVAAEDFQTIFGPPDGLVTDLVVRVANPRELPTIALKIAERLPDTRIILRDEMLRTYDAVFSWRGGLLALILLGVILAFVIISWDKASGLSPEERREIGILKAVGWETSDIILMKFWEGAVVSLSAFLLGVLLAYAHVFFFSAGLFAPVLKGWSVLYPRFRLVPFIDASQLIALFFLTVVPYAAATVIPSWRASVTDPDAIMKGLR